MDKMKINEQRRVKKEVSLGDYLRGAAPRRCKEIESIHILHCCATNQGLLQPPLLPRLLKAPLSNHPFIPQHTLVKTRCHSSRNSITTGN